MGDVDKTLSKAEGIFNALAGDNQVNDRVVNILGLAPPPLSSPATPTPSANNGQLRATSNPVPIQQNGKLNVNSYSRERHGTESSNTSSSLNHSSSVKCFLKWMT